MLCKHICYQLSPLTLFMNKGHPFLISTGVQSITYRIYPHFSLFQLQLCLASSFMDSMFLFMLYSF